jgi:Na+/H+ antiporter NhaC
METETLIKSVGSFMDSLESITNWLILIMLLKVWNAYTGKGDFEVLGAKITKKHIATILLSVYCFAFAAIVLQLGRLHEALRYIPDAQFKGAATQVVTHAWLLNPFSYFGDDLVQILFEVICCGLWSIIWWVGLLSIYSAQPDPKKDLHIWLLTYYWLTSFGILVLIFFVYTSLSRNNFGRSFWILALLKLVGILVGIIVGRKLYNYSAKELPVDEVQIEKPMD